jgi:hypothetical protein
VQLEDRDRANLRLGQQAEDQAAQAEPGQDDVALGRLEEVAVVAEAEGGVGHRELPVEQEHRVLAGRERVAVRLGRPDALEPLGGAGLVGAHAPAGEPSPSELGGHRQPAGDPHRPDRG